jgi:diaminopimelate epimerase
MKIQFYKYQGTGNDFIIIDNRQQLFPSDDKNFIARLCTRQFGIGADGLILLEDDAALDFKMVYFNADGSESTMCGNGGRCIAAFARQLGIVQDETNFVAIDGPHKAYFSEDKVYLQMKDVDIVHERGHDLVLNTGSPHYIIFSKDVDKINIIVEAHNIRYNHEFKIEGINVNFVELLDNRSIKVRTYERGVEDETYSCGTGVVAAAIASYLNPDDDFPQEPEIITTIETKGGRLEVSFVVNEEGHFTNVTLIGPAEKVFSGELEV